MNRPFPVYTGPHGRLVTVEVIITVEPESHVAPGDLEEVLDDMMERTDQALDGIFAGLPIKVKTNDLSVVNPPHVPFFPVTFGGAVCAEPTEVYDAIERLREGTPLGGLLYDAAGRAFEACVWASFRRVHDEDRVLKACQPWWLPWNIQP